MTKSEAIEAIKNLHNSGMTIAEAQGPLLAACKSIDNAMLISIISTVSASIIESTEIIASILCELLPKEDKNA